MIKAMLFIDGSWLYANLPELGKIYGKPDFQIDFGKLPTVLAEDVAEQAGIGTIDLVRTYYFASYAENYDVRDVAAVQRRMAFFSRLREDYNYEVEAFPINYQGRRLRRADRDPADDFVPKEKCVDISLAITVMHYATLPGAMDVAILLVGDRDFVPLLCDIRRRGVRVAVASIYGSCAQELADPADAARVRDFDVVWLNDLLDRIEYVGDEQAVGAGQQHEQDAATASAAAAARRVWTTNVPRWGRRPAWLRHRDDLLRAAGIEGYAAEFEGAPAAGEVLRGRIKNVIWDRGFGFIAADDGPDYFFHANALGDGLTFDELQPEMDVVFEVKAPPTATRAGAALLVRRHAPAGDDGEDAAAEGRAEEVAAAATAASGDDDDDDDGHGAAAAAAAAGAAREGGGGGALVYGRVKNVIWDRGFGFIAADDGPDYFFHANALTGDLTFEALQPGLAVAFEVKAPPTALRAGAALAVRRAASAADAGGGAGSGAGGAVTTTVVGVAVAIEGGAAEGEAAEGEAAGGEAAGGEAAEGEAAGGEAADRRPAAAGDDHHPAAAEAAAPGAGDQEEAGEDEPARAAEALDLPAVNAAARRTG